MNRFWNVKIETRPLKSAVASAGPRDQTDKYGKVHERERRLFHIKIIDDDASNAAAAARDYLAEEAGLFEEEAVAAAAAETTPASNLIAAKSAEEDNIDSVDDVDDADANGGNDQEDEEDDEDDFSSSFKIRAAKSNQFISNEVLDQLRLGFFTGPSGLFQETAFDALVNCIYNGRNRRVSLYVVGCDHPNYAGLLIINDNLYLIRPLKHVVETNRYRIELLPNRVKYASGIDNDLLNELVAREREGTDATSARKQTRRLKAPPFRQPESKSSGANLPARRQTIDVKLSLDKSYFRGLSPAPFFVEEAAFYAYLRETLFQFNLVNSYYLSEHNIGLRLRDLHLVDYEEPDAAGRSPFMNDRSLLSVDSEFRNRTTMPQLFLSLIKQNSFQQSFKLGDAEALPSEETDAPSQASSSNELINVYIVNRKYVVDRVGGPNETSLFNHLFMNQRHLGVDGLATQSTVNLCNTRSNSTTTQPAAAFKKLPYESIVLVKDRSTAATALGGQERPGIGLATIEQANIIIDLIGHTLGNRHTDARLAEANDEAETDDGDATTSAASECKSNTNDFNWYFQLKNNHLNSVRLLRLRQRSSPISSSGEGQPGPSSASNCINRRIVVQRNRFCLPPGRNQTQMRLQSEGLFLINLRMKSALVKYINEFKKKSLCGNGVIDLDYGEQCDCGGASIDLDAAATGGKRRLQLYDYVKSCNLNCCDMRTCRFRKPEMQCSAGECCNDQCRLKEKNHICRSARQPACDFIEYCDGKTPTCPVDLFYHNGLDCFVSAAASNATASLRLRDESTASYEKGTCWNGVCVSKNMQCKAIWSTESSSSDPVCYKNFNTIGFENGNCGVVNTTSTSTSGFRKCLEEDAECGLLNCQFGLEQPLVRTENYFKSTTIRNGEKYECKQVAAGPGQESVYAQDGSECSASSSSSSSSDKRVCVSRKCTSLATVLGTDASAAVESTVNRCVADKRARPLVLCSDNGICDNAQNCHCFNGYSGKHCETQLDVRFERPMGAAMGRGDSLMRQPSLFAAHPTSNSSSSSSSSGTAVSSLFSGKQLGVLPLAGLFSLFVIVAFLLAFFLFRRRRRGQSSKRSGFKEAKETGYMGTTTLKTNFLNEEREETYASIYTRNGPCLLAESKSSKRSAAAAKRSKNDAMAAAAGNSSCLTNASENDFDLSLTKLNKAIQQLNKKPGKSILKKHANRPDDADGMSLNDEDYIYDIDEACRASACIYNTLPLKGSKKRSGPPAAPQLPGNAAANVSGSSFKLEQQANINTLLNSMSRTAALRQSGRTRPGESNGDVDEQAIYDNNQLNASGGANRSRSPGTLSSSSSLSESAMAEGGGELNESASSATSSNGCNSYSSSESLSISSSLSKTQAPSSQGRLPPLGPKKKRRAAALKKNRLNKLNDSAATYEVIPATIQEVTLKSPMKMAPRLPDRVDSVAAPSNTTTFMYNNRLNEMLSSKMTKSTSSIISDLKSCDAATAVSVQQSQFSEPKSAKILQLSKLNDVKEKLNREKNEILEAVDASSKSKAGYLKVQDYLNELNILSKQNSFAKLNSGGVGSAHKSESGQTGGFDLASESFDADIEAHLDANLEQAAADVLLSSHDLAAADYSSQTSVPPFVLNGGVQRAQGGSFGFAKSDEGARLSQGNKPHDLIFNPLSPVRMLGAKMKSSNGSLVSSPAKSQAYYDGDEAAASYNILLTPKRPMSLMTSNKAKEMPASPLKNMHLQPLQLNVKSQDMSGGIGGGGQGNSLSINVHTNNSETSSGYSSITHRPQLGYMKQQSSTSTSIASSSSANTSESIPTITLNSIKLKEAHKLGESASSNSGGSAGSQSISSTSSSTSLSITSPLSQSPQLKQQQQQAKQMVHLQHTMLSSDAYIHHHHSSSSSSPSHSITPMKPPGLTELPGSTDKRLSYMMATHTTKS